MIVVHSFSSTIGKCISIHCDTSSSDVIYRNLRRVQWCSGYKPLVSAMLLDAMLR